MSESEAIDSNNSVLNEAPSRVNPFKKFIDQSLAGFPTAESEVPKPADSASGGGEVGNSNLSNEDIEKAWVQYLDDESGYLYWYNEVTGEARWVTEEEQQAYAAQSQPIETQDTTNSNSIPIEAVPTIDSAGGILDPVAGNNTQSYDSQAQAPLIISSAWEKYYDEDGNPFFYNKETGVSEWEIPAGEVYMEGNNLYNNGMQDGGIHDTFGGTWLGDDGSLSRKEDNTVEGSVSGGGAVGGGGSRVLKSVSSFRSIRSARSVGLHSPQKQLHKLSSKASFSSLANLESSLDSKEGKLMPMLSVSSKELKSVKSFSSGKQPNVSNDLKPKSPLKRQSKSGFQMLKEGAVILREATDSDGTIWLEYQSADDGPIFYAAKDSTVGQWGKPSVFVSLDSSAPVVLTPASKNGGSATREFDSSMSEASVGEIVDYFIAEHMDEALTSPLTPDQKQTRFAKEPEVFHLERQTSEVVLDTLQSDGVVKDDSQMKKQGDIIEGDKQQQEEILQDSKLPPASMTIKVDNDLPRDDDATLNAKSVIEANDGVGSITSASLDISEDVRQLLADGPTATVVSPIPKELKLALEHQSKAAYSIISSDSKNVANVSSTAQNSSPSVTVQPTDSANISSTTTPAALRANHGESTMQKSDVNSSKTPLTSALNALPPSDSKKDESKVSPKPDAKQNSEILQEDATKETTSAPAPAPASLSAIQAHIQSIQAEAALELQKLQERFKTSKPSIEGSKAVDVNTTTTPPAQKPSPVSEAIDTARSKNSVKSLPSIAEDKGDVRSVQQATDDASVNKKEEGNKAGVAEREIIDEKNVDWIELYARSHVIQRSGHWIVLIDTTTENHFFRNSETGKFQFEKPEEIGEIAEARHFPMLKSMTNRSILKSSESPKVNVADSKIVGFAHDAPSSAKESISITNNPVVVPIAAAAAPKVVAASNTATSSLVALPSKEQSTASSAFPSPAQKSATVRNSTASTIDSQTSSLISQQQLPVSGRIELSPGISTPLTSFPETRNGIRSSFLTLVNMEENESINEPNGYKEEDLQAKYDFGREPDLNFSKELAFAEKKAAKELHSYLQRDYQSQEIESEILLQRLQALSAERQMDVLMGNNHTSTMNGKGRLNSKQQPTIDTLDRDEMRKLHSRSRHLIERCCDILEQIEISPTEHLINEQHLLKAAMQLRNLIPDPLCPRHDGPVNDFLPAMWFFPSYPPLQDYWKNRRDGQNLPGDWTVFSLETSSSSSAIEIDPFQTAMNYPRENKRWYYHKPSGLVQRGEPFDIFIKKSKIGLKREPWSEYEVNTIVDQKIMEQRGIELLADDHGGYLFYCPVRKTYSSNGIFQSLKQSPVFSTRPQTTTTATNNNNHNHGGISAAIATNTTHVWKASYANKVGNISSKTDLNVWSSFRFTTNVHTQMTSSSHDNIPSQTTTKDLSIFKTLDHYRSAFLKNNQMMYRQNGEQSPFMNTTITSYTDDKEDDKEREGNDSIDLHFNVLEEAFAVARNDLLTLSAPQTGLTALQRVDVADATIRYDGVDQENEMLLMLKFEENMDMENYAKYHNHILSIAMDPDNPFPLLELMEFLLLMGLGKIALAVFKHAMDTMKTSLHFTCQPYEMAMGHILSQKISMKYFNYYESFSNVISIVERFHESSFILAHIASYFYKLRRWEWSEILFLSALMHDPNHLFSLLSYSHLLIEKGDYRTAQRQLQRCIEASTSTSTHDTNTSMQYASIARLEMNWLQELQKGQEEHVLLGYKNSLTIGRKDRIQSYTLHSIGAYYQFSQDNKIMINNECLEYYKRSLQVDEDNAMASLLWACATSVLSLMEITTSIEQQQQKQKPQRRSSSSEGNKTISNSNSTPALLLNNHNHRAVSEKRSGGQTLLLASTVAGGTRTIRSATPSRPGRQRLFTTQSADANNGNPSNSNNSNSNPLGMNQMDSLTSASWILEVDSNFRKGLVLMPNAPYRWIVLLTYADFILSILRDQYRAKQYLEEAVQISFSSYLWPILALGYYYQYVVNDYEATSHLFLRALRSRHPESTILSLETFQDFHRIAAGGGSNNRSNTSSSSSQQPSSSMEFDLEVLGSEGNGNGTTATTRPLDGQHPDILDSIVLYTAIAYLLWDMDHISIAKVYATAALRLCPSYGPAARCIATLLFFEGERRLCFRYINVALDHVSQGSFTNIFTLRSCAMMRAIRYQYDDAIRLLDRTCLITPNDSLSHKTLAILYSLYKQRIDKAMYHLQQAFIISRQEDMEVLRLQGQILMEDRQFKEARFYLMEALKLVPFDSITLANLAICVFFIKIEKRSHNEHFVMQRNYSQFYREFGFSDDLLTSLAHSRDPYELFEAALALQPRERSTTLRGDDGYYTNPFESQQPQLSVLSDSQLFVDTPQQQQQQQQQAVNQTMMMTGGLASQSVLGMMSTRQSPSSIYPSIASSPLASAYIMFLYGCFELSRVAEDSLVRAKLLFTTAASQLNSQRDGSLYPLILYQLAAISEAEGDLATAERQYDEALQLDGLHPLTLLRLIGNIEDSLSAIKSRLRKLKEPFTGKSHGKKKRKKNKKSAAASSKGNGNASGGGGGGGGGSNDFTDLEAVREKQKAYDDQYGQFAPLMDTLDLNETGNEEDDDGLDEPLPMHNHEASLLLKKLMMHQRIQETAMIKKFSYQKLLKDIPKSTVLPKISYVFVDSDWIQRTLYAFSKCEDWTHLMKQLD